MEKPQPHGVETLARQPRHGLFGPIHRIPQNRVADVGQVDPDLVGAPGDELAAHQGEPVPDGQGLVQCDGRLGPWPGTAAHGDLFFCLIFQNVALQPAGGARESSVDYAEVVFFQLTVPDLLVHDP